MPPVAEPPPPVETVVVRAARLPPPLSEAAFSLVRVDTDALAEEPRLDLALEQVPGVSLFRRVSSLGANPTTQGVSVRAIGGSGASRALVTLDGVPQNDPFGGWVIWSGLPGEAVQRATVVLGAGAGPYGAGALTGTIALEGRERVAGGVAGELSAGGLGDRRGVGLASVEAGGADLLVVGSGESSDGWTPVRERRGAADDHLTLSDWSGAAGLQTPVGERATLAARFAAYQEDRSAGLVGAGSRARGQQGSLTLAAPPEGARLGWRLQAWASGSDLANRSVSVAPSRATTTPADDQYATPAVGWGLNAAVRRALPGGEVELGADLRGAEGESRELFRYLGGAFTRSRVAGGATLVGGVYAEAIRSAGRWLLTGGARMDGWSDYGGRRLERTLATGAPTLDLRPADQSGAVPTGRAGVRRAVGEEGLDWRAAAYAGFRPATLNELHRPFRVGNDVTEADAALKPERLYGVETGLEQAKGAGRWAATVFYNRLQDAVSNVTLGAGPATFPIAGLIPAGGVLRRRENVGAVDAVGVEADGSRDFGSRLTLRLAAAYTEARVDGARVASQLTGLRPAETPRVTLTGGADWRATADMTLSADLRLESARYEDDLNTRRLAPAAKVDLRLERRLPGRLSAYVAVQNLFDAAIRTGQTADGVYSYDAPRYVTVGLRLRPD